MKTRRKIVVTAQIAAPLERVWELTQAPAEHVRWDIRFTDIVPSSSPGELSYKTRIGFGVAIEGWGRYLASQEGRLSTFAFGSDSWRSLIREGRGIWEYEARDGGVFFRTVYDYEVRFGVIGRALDRLLFRPVMQLATEWGFETLRRWAEGDAEAPRTRASRLAFGRFFVARFLAARLFGREPAPGAARSWLGSGTRAEVEMCSRS